MYSDTQRVTVCIPIYKSILSDTEVKILNYSLRYFSPEILRILVPDSINRDFLKQTFPAVKFIGFKEEFFKSERSYSQLLLKPEFYDSFESEFLLIVQNDALIFKDSLGEWISADYDYIGAPWFGGIDFPFAALTANLPSNAAIRPMIGNGGLSLRRLSTMRTILDSFSHQAAIWSSVGNPEDVFLGMAAQLLPNIRLPTLYTAASFSIETFPSYYLRLLNGEAPFGCHAFDKYQPEIWRQQPFWPMETLDD